MFIFIAHLDQTLDRLYGIEGVQGGDHEVTAVCCGKSGVECDFITDFADDDDIGVCTHQTAHGSAEIAVTDFPL